MNKPAATFHVTGTVLDIWLANSGKVGRITVEGPRERRHRITFFNVHLLEAPKPGNMVSIDGEISTDKVQFAVIRKPDGSEHPVWSPQLIGRTLTMDQSGDQQSLLSEPAAVREGAKPDDDIPF